MAGFFCLGGLTHCCLSINICKSVIDGSCISSLGDLCELSLEFR